MAGDDNDLGRIIQFANLLQDVEAVHSWQPNIKQDYIEGFFAQQLQARLTALSSGWMIAFVFEHALKRVADRRLVVDDKNVKHCKLRGRCWQCERQWAIQ